MAEFVLSRKTFEATVARIRELTKEPLSLPQTAARHAA